MTLALPYLGGLWGGGSSKVLNSEECDACVDRDGALSGGSGDDRAYTDGTDLLAADCEEVTLGSHLDAWDRNPYRPAPLRR